MRRIAASALRQYTDSLPAVKWWKVLEREAECRMSRNRWRACACWTYRGCWPVRFARSCSPISGPKWSRSSGLRWETTRGNGDRRFYRTTGRAAYYVSCNRGKRSLALDLSRPEARGVLDDLIRVSDVLIENFLPQSLEKLGLTAERMEKLNPRLVRVSISGYGRTGPSAATPGYDLVVQATAGIMSITGEPDGTPMKIGVAITDILSGLYAAVSVLAGLFGASQRASPAGATGAAFDLALADCTLASLVNVVQVLSNGRAA